MLIPSCQELPLGPLSLSLEGGEPYPGALNIGRVTGLAGDGPHTCCTARVRPLSSEGLRPLGALGRSLFPVNLGLLPPSRC